jgi:NAD(P)-dependent dehydrogenase (short-subunit alcohol dehydrogenase family)
VAKAVVTGGARGIGRAVADGLTREGWKVDSWSRSEGVDVTDAVQVAEAARRAGPVDLLVSNAGTMDAVGLPWSVAVDDWRRDLETSVVGTYLAARALLPGMIERRAGRIVTVASNVAVRPSPYQSGYAAGKAAVLSLTEALAAAAGSHGVKVFAISPGYVDTDMTRRMHELAAGETWAGTLGSGETVDPDRTVRLVLFLASGRGDALSGRYIHALDDVEELARRAEEIARDDLHVSRVRKLS